MMEYDIHAVSLPQWTFRSSPEQEEYNAALERRVAELERRLDAMQRALTNSPDE